MIPFKTLPDNKILDVTKLKAFADDILTLPQTANFGVLQTERVCRRHGQIG